MIRKIQIDPTAAFVYSLGCSLIHFAMFFSIWVIQMPDQKSAKIYDTQLIHL